MTKASIRIHATTAMKRYERTAARVAADLAKIDSEAKALARRTDLYPGERQRMQQDLEQRAQDVVRVGKQTMRQHLAEDRQRARYVEALDAETVARRSYFAQVAATDLAGTNGPGAVAMIRNMVDAGDLERAREYGRLARAQVADLHDSVELAQLLTRAQPEDAKAHNSWAAACDAIDDHLFWFDRNLDDVAAQVGRVDPEVQAGRATEEPLNTRGVTLWARGADERAAAAFSARAAAQEAVDPVGDAMSGGEPVGAAQGAQDGAEGGDAA